jgi:CubicO group peptidase (beta-lactamase class C family)
MQLALQALLDNVTAAANVSLQLSFKTAEYNVTVASGHVGPVGQERAVTPRDTWLFGSGTKAMTAAMIMQAHEVGLLHVNDTAATHIDALFQASLNQSFVELFGSWAGSITIWELLTMQAGLPDFDVEDFDTEVLTSAYMKEWQPLDLVVYAASQPRVCHPGRCVSYSSTNYIILGYVLLACKLVDPGSSMADWSKLPQKLVMRRAASAAQSPTEIVEVLRDLHFGLEPAMNESGLSVPGWSGYGGGVAIDGQPAGVLGWTCGNAMTTTAAMAQFYWDLLVGQTAVSAETLELMKSTKTITKGWAKGHLEYGAGLFVQQTSDRWLPWEKPPTLGDWGTTVGHGGATYGFLSDQGLIPQLNATWSYAGNNDDGSWADALTCQIIKVAAKVRLGEEPQLKCPVLDSKEGSLQRGAALRRPSWQPKHHHDLRIEDIVV